MASKNAEKVNDVTTKRNVKIKNTSGFVDNWQHERTILESLRYSLKNNILCDVTFIVGEDRTRIQAHKLILSLRSCVFHAMLTGQLKEQDDIVIPDTEAEIFHLFLEFLYTDKTDFKPKNVIQLLYLARKYDVANLEKRCLNYLETKMTTVDACLLLEESHIYKQDDISVTCLRYIWKNGEAVLNSESFTDLCRECLGKIIESDDLNATEETVFQSCMKWSEAECRRQEKEITPENQREVLGKELYLIRFPLLDSEYFQNKVLPKDILIDSEKFETLCCYMYPEKDVLILSKSRRVGTKRKLIKIDRFENMCFQGVDDNLSWYSDTITFCLNTNASLKGFSILTFPRKSKTKPKDSDNFSDAGFQGIPQYSYQYDVPQSEQQYSDLGYQYAVPQSKQQYSDFGYQYAVPQSKQQYSDFGYQYAVTKSKQQYSDFGYQYAVPQSKKEVSEFGSSGAEPESGESVSIKASVCEVSTDVIVPGSSVDKQIRESVFDVDFPSPLDIKKDTHYSLTVQTQGRVRCKTVNRQGEIREGFLKCTFSDSQRCSHTVGIKTNIVSRLKFLV